jgi:hypothetical protein
LSIVQANVIAPVRGTEPNVGRKPVVPQRVEGDEIEPNVSEPIAKATHPAAVAEADPADEPLDPWAVFQGLRVRFPLRRGESIKRIRKKVRANTNRGADG